MKLKDILRIILIVFIAAGLNLSQAQEKNEKDKHSAGWKYSGELGPGNWGNIKPEYAPCKNGYEQSPVDINTVYKTKLNPLKLTYFMMPIDLINNGHTIQQNCPEGNNAVIGGHEFRLVQFHFHTPSEHTVNGKGYPLEMHLVHKDKSGAIAVIGVFFKEGKQNKALQKIIDDLPAEADQAVKNKATAININELLPANKKYYHYYGSLTTPPCTEDVDWNILKTPVTASREQIKKLHDVIGYNARPVQTLHNRFILESE